MPTRRDTIRGVLASFEAVLLEPAIPARKLANAREHCRVPENEEVLGLIDCTVFGSAKHAVVFGTRRIYMRDRWTGGGVTTIGYTEIPKLEQQPGFARTTRRDPVSRPTREVLAALRDAMRVEAENVRDQSVRTNAPLVPAIDPGDDHVSISPEATALHAAITAEPDDVGPQLVLADLLLAAEDPRGELIVLHHHETSAGITDPEALERYLLLAAEYGFPHARPEPPDLPWAGNATNPVAFRVVHLLRAYDVYYRRTTLELHVGGRSVLGRRLRTERSGEWTPAEAATILRVIGDAIAAGTPLSNLRFPYSDDPLPSYKGCALRVYALPREFTAPRGIPESRYGLAARDFEHWMNAWRRLARMGGAANAVAS